MARFLPDGPTCLDWDALRCRFGCNDPVVSLLHAPRGCICWTDQIQALCAQHTVKGLQNNNMEVILMRSDLGRDNELGEDMNSGSGPTGGDEDHATSGQEPRPTTPTAELIARAETFNLIIRQQAALAAAEIRYEELKSTHIEKTEAIRAEYLGQYLSLQGALVAAEAERAQYKAKADAAERLLDGVRAELAALGPKGAWRLSLIDKKPVTGN